MSDPKDERNDRCARRMIPTPNDRFERGLAALQAIDPKHPLAVLAGVSDIAPDFAAFLVEYAYGDIGSRPGLEPRLRELIAVSALAAMGSVKPQLKARFTGALNLGWSVDELVELLMQISVVAGFPAALNGLSALKELLDEIEPTGPR